MPEDVISPASSAGTEATPPPQAPTETPNADPVKAAIERGDHPEMNRLLNEAKQRRMSGKSTPKVTPSPADSATATPVTAPEPGAGTEPREPPTPTEPQPGSKEYNFRAIQAERDNWKTKAQEIERRALALERRLAEPPASPRPAEPAKPLDIPFTEPRPDLEKFDSLADWQKADTDWLNKRDAHRDREIQSRTRQSLAAESQQQQLVRIATTIREKVDALAKTEGFEDFPELYADSQSPYTDEMLKFYADDEHGARVMHYMILNPGKAQEVTMLPSKLQKTRLAEIRDALVKPQSKAPTKQTTDAPNPIRRAVTGRTEAPVDPIKAAREEGERTGNWAKFNHLMNERKRQRMATA